MHVENNQSQFKKKDFLVTAITAMTAMHMIKYSKYVRCADKVKRIKLTVTTKWLNTVFITFNHIN